MKHVLLSLVLPFCSHVLRQSVACNNTRIEAIGFTLFLVAYAFSMVVHSCYVDRYMQTVGRIGILGFMTTAVLCVVLNMYAPSYFLVGWVTHAFFSSMFWPIGYALVNDKKRSRTALTVWSLQGNVGDFCGCAYHLFDSPLASTSVAPSCVLLAGLLTSMVLMPPKRETLLQSHERSPAPTRIYGSMSITIVAAASLKTMTYAASNFMPTLQFDYLSYNIGTVLGTLFAGMAADIWSSSLVLVAILNLATTGGGLAWNLWTDMWFTVSYGIVSAFASTTLSICLCTDLAEKLNFFGKTTALMDGTSTLIAAILQLTAIRNFKLLQLVSSITFLVASVSYRLVTQFPCRRAP